MAGKIKITVTLFLTVFLLGLCACSSQPYEGQTWAYDTLCTAKVWGGQNISAVFSSAAQEGQTLLSKSGAKEVTAEASGQTIEISSEFAKILNQSGIIYNLTDGVFDLTVAPLSKLWDVNHATTPPAGEDIEKTLSLVDFSGLTVTDSTLTFSKQGMGIDIGSVGKGYGADYTVKALKNAGATAGVVSFGGNVALFGTRDGAEFRIGIRDPQGDKNQYLGILSATDCSIVTSGGYERYFEYTGTVYHHLLDANTGYPRQSDLLSVTVVCADGAQADLMSTALWLMGEEQGWELYETLNQTEGFLPAEVIFVSSDGTVRISEGLAENFELTSNRYTLG